MAGRFQVRIPAKARFFRFFRASSPSVEPKWPYTRCVQGANFSGLKRLERNVGQSTVSNVEDENKRGSAPLFSRYFFEAWIEGILLFCTSYCLLKRLHTNSRKNPSKIQSGQFHYERVTVILILVSPYMDL
jgi:hypothetical protein